MQTNKSITNYPCMSKSLTAIVTLSVSAFSSSCSASSAAIFSFFRATSSSSLLNASLSRLSSASCISVAMSAFSFPSKWRFLETYPPLSGSPLVLLLLLLFLLLLPLLLGLGSFIDPVVVVSGTSPVEGSTSDKNCALYDLASGQSMKLRAVVGPYCCVCGGSHCALILQVCSKE
ncbi:hypothetical protein BJY04DRAFT_180472 [Aspergillus karnatakaensis]|uniref:uncharacterized protein n=1 Tax=Aspergillus karnatakaensis TaxID=1810916 RepID=UPI003CCD9A5E